MNTFYQIHKNNLLAILFLVVAIGIPLSTVRAQDQGFSMDFLGENSTIEVAEDGGTLEIVSNADGEVSQAIFKVGVIVRSDQLNLDCDTMIYTVKEKIIVAEGNPVIIKQGGGIDATCRHFRYNTETGKAELTGKPIIKQKGGNIVTGKKIILMQNKDGSTKVLVDSGKIKSGNGSNNSALRKPRAIDEEIEDQATITVRNEKEKDQKVSSTKSKSPIKIDSRSINKIPELDLDGDI